MVAARAGRDDTAVYGASFGDGNLCVAIGGYGGPGIGIKLGGKGNITESHRLWRNEGNPQSIGTGILLGKYLFRANATRKAGVDCIDATTGKHVWSV